MERAYHKFHSRSLGRDMELLHFGVSGVPLLAFPTSMGRFYQWEDFGLVGALADWIDRGAVQVVCLDSVDEESWYAKDKAPADRVARHLEYERYVLDEVLPGMPVPPITCGTSFGAMHAVLLALRHPTRCRGFIALSGAFDTARWLDGFSDDSTYFTNPLAFLPRLTDDRLLRPLRETEFVIATGVDDPNVDGSRRIVACLQDKGVPAMLHLWNGWSHDWPYWKEMVDTFL